MRGVEEGEEDSALDGVEFFRFWRGDFFCGAGGVGVADDFHADERVYDGFEEVCCGDGVALVVVDGVVAGDGNGGCSGVVCCNELVPCE